MTVMAHPTTYLRVLSLYGFILCTVHGCCYSPKNLEEHLKRKHGMIVKRVREIEAWIGSHRLAPTLIQPPDHIKPIAGLKEHEGFRCNFSECAYRTVSRESIQRHCSQDHGIDSRRRQQEREIYSAVMIQSLFLKTRDYFITTTKPPDPRR
jgi:hypothetical protein